MDSTLPVLTSGCVETMYNMDLLYLTDTWGPARVECTLLGSPGAGHQIRPPETTHWSVQYAMFDGAV